MKFKSLKKLNLLIKDLTISVLNLRKFLNSDKTQKFFLVILD